MLLDKCKERLFFRLTFTYSMTMMMTMMIMMMMIRTQINPLRINALMVVDRSPMEGNWRISIKFDAVGE